MNPKLLMFSAQIVTIDGNFVKLCNKKYKYIFINIVAIIVAFFVVLTEYFFASFITPNFYSTDANKLLSYTFKDLHERINE